MPIDGDLKKTKEKLVSLLKKHGYHQDERPDHREWMKSFENYLVKIRLDQMDPEGFKGFSFELIAFMRYGIKKSQVLRILNCLDKWYETR